MGKGRGGGKAGLARGGGKVRINFVHRSPTAKRQKSTLHFDHTDRIRARIVFDPVMPCIITMHELCLLVYYKEL